MRVDGLLIPEGLVGALEAGRWPRTHQEANEQNVRLWVSAEGIRQLAPEQDWLVLYPPPFATLAGLRGESLDFYTRYAALHQLVPAASIEIACFGLGVDAMIVLDYRAGPSGPRVIRLVWGRDGQPNRWVPMAPDFPTFAAALGL